MKQILLLLLLLAGLAHGQILPNGKPGCDPRIYGQLVEYWDADKATTTIWQHTNRTTNWSANGQHAAAWDGVLLGSGSTVKGSSDGGSAVCNTNVFGTHNAVYFDGTFTGLNGGFTSTTLTGGCTIIFIGTFLDATNNRAWFSMGPDASTPPYSTANGFFLGADGSGNLKIDRLESDTHPLVYYPALDTNPTMVVVTFNQTLSTAVWFGGSYQGFSGISKTFYRGNLPRGYGVYGNQANPVVAQTGMGTRSDSQFAATKAYVNKIFLFKGELSPKALQLFYQNYVVPTLGTGACGTVAAFPTSSGERQGYLHGPGLNMNWSRIPILDLINSFHIQWVRLDLTSVGNPTDAALNEMIAFYGGERFTIDPAHPVSVAPSQGDTYTNNGFTYTVISTNISGGVGTITTSGLGWPQASGNLVRASGSGDSTITFSSYVCPETIGLDFTLPSTVTAGAFNSVTTIAQHVCSAMAAAGYAQTFLELGNECIQLHTPPISADFANETAAENAYVMWLNSFQSGMAGYNYIVAAVNDEPVYDEHTYQRMIALGGTPPSLWGMHGYSVSNGTAGANMPGTMSLLSAITNASAVMTEGNYAAPNSTQAQCIAYFTNMYTNMGGQFGQPWCYFTAGSSSWNSTTLAYGLYTSESFDGNGIGVWTTPSATGLGISAAEGWTTPTG